ncbi:hypothetical protein ACQP1V_36270 [Microtetraspora malaysiensis]|uniref:hypothetical protein n=1 Tax=Microtetraspora malaysiensis TaxID=161358 RepID=UPI003D91B351
MILDQPADFITVAELKMHLNKSSSVTVDDVELARFVSAACRIVVDRVGHVSPVAAVTDRSVRHDQLVLEHRPVVSITSVVKLPGGEAVPAADELAGTNGWSLTSPEGVLSVAGMSGRLRVSYMAGRDPIPGRITMAALELAAHLWRGSQLNQAGGRPALGDSDALSASVRPYALPYRVIELLGLKPAGVMIRDQPLVG